MNNKLCLSSLGIICSLGGSSAFAANFGSDLNLTLTAATGGMAGAGYVRPQDPVASVFGNPATLGQLKGQTDFTFGASYLNVDAHADHDGSTTGFAFEADSDAEQYLLPNIAVRQRVTDDLVLGGGLQVISGLGADFREDTPLAPVVELIVFGANMEAAYDITEKTTVGAGMTLAFGLLEFGLVSNTATQETFGLRGNLGVTHDLGPVMLGLTYNSELELDFENVTESSPGNFSDVKLEQPREIIVGLATTSAMMPNLLIEANVMWKNWDDAEGYQDIWQDTYTLALGGQYTISKWKLRAGYSYSSDLENDDVGNSLAKLTSLNSPFGVLPVSPPLVQFVQATLTQPYWQQQITAGVGYALTDKINFDVQAGYAFDGDRTIGATKLEVNEFQLGAGFTWAF
jgi:long-chain fatty acid transport protein